MSTVSVKAHFAAGHRILGLTGEGAKCRNIHGHTFHVTWVYGQHPDLEFGTLKNALRKLVRRSFDHTFILDKADDFKQYLIANMLSRYELDGPPTTEKIAAEIARLSTDRLNLPWDEVFNRPYKESQLNDSIRPLYPDARLLKVILEEGPENCATWEAETPAYWPINTSPVTWTGGTGTFTQ